MSAAPRNTETPWANLAREKLTGEQPYGLTRSGGRLDRGLCPSCGKKELWVGLDQPYVIRCNRVNKCGWEQRVKDLWPDLNTEVWKRNPPTTKNPNATAEAYLSSRGFDLDRWRGHFRQGRLTVDSQEWHTVRVELSGGAVWHRLIGRSGDHKTHFEGPFRGQVWTWLEFAQLDLGEVWLVEGVFEAMSLGQVGIPAVSLMSSSHHPLEWLEQWRNRRITWVVALNNDPAGRKGAKTLLAKLRSRGLEAKQALPPDATDYNDLLVQGRLDPDMLDECRFAGSLASAESPQDFYLHWLTRKQGEVLFDFEDRTWRGYEGKEGAASVTMAADFCLRLRYSVVDDSLAAAPVVRQMAEIRMPDEKQPKQVRFEARELADVKSFKRACMERFSGVWTGNAQVLDSLMLREMRRRLPKVRLLPYTGYDRRSDCYVFRDQAYGPGGESVVRGEEGFYTLAGHHLDSTDLESVRSFDPEHDLRIWHPDLFAAYGVRGLLALGFETASLFAEQFFRESGFFPFLSLCGDPGTGKTSLKHLLHSLFARDIAEGIPASSANTAKGQIRTIAKRSNLCMSLLEANQDRRTRFEFDSLHELFNRQPLQIRAATSNTGETIEIPFLATISLIWNTEQIDKPALKERTVSVPFLASENTSDSLSALRRLERLMRAEPERLGGLRHWVLTRRGEFFEALLDEWRREAERLNHVLQNTRVSEVHALPYAGWAALVRLAMPEDYVGLRDSVQDYLLERGQWRIATLNEGSDLIEQFFDALGFLADREALDVTPEGWRTEELWVQIPALRSAASRHGLASLFNDTTTLFSQLRADKRLVSANRSSRLRDGSVAKVWRFRRLH